MKQGYNIPVKTSIFIDVSPLGGSSYLLGLAKENYYKLVGGGVEDGQTLEEALESEANTEAKATLNPDLFGHREFNLNINIVHGKAFACLVTLEKKLIKKPFENRAPCELKIILRGQEVTENTPVGVKELSRLDYYPSKKGLNMRNFFAYGLGFRETMWEEAQTVCYMPPTHIARRYLRTRFTDYLNIDPAYTEKLLITRKRARKGLPAQPQQRCA